MKKKVNYLLIERHLFLFTTFQERENFRWPFMGTITYHVKYAEVMGFRPQHVIEIIFLHAKAMKQ